MKNKIMTIWKSLVIGVWITTLNISCVFLVIYSLSSYQFQDKLNSIPNISTKLDSVFIEHECDLSSVTVKERASIVKVPCLPKKTQLDEKYYSPGMALAIYKEVIELANTEINNFKSLEKSLQDQIAKLKIERDSADSAKEKENINDDIENLNGNLYTIDLKLKDLNEKQKNSFKEHELLVETFSDIEYFDSFFNIFSDMFGVKSFWAMPRQILEIVLILSMGILGSLMFVTIDFIKEKGSVKSGKIAMYLFRPSLGMIVALSIYVMAKSGQSTFTGSDTEYLSPFVISFLGIISGLLAEKAYAKLAQTGSTVLNTNAQKDCN